MTNSTTEKTVNLFSMNSSDAWQKYARGRPIVPPSLWRRIYAYHSSHGGEFNTVNDLGGGVGIFSGVLGQKFAKVILTDPGEGHMELAKKVLLADGDEGKFEFVAAKGEDDSAHRGVVDMVFASNAVHWMDVGKAVASVTAQLKPGGTLVFVMHGMSVMDDLDVQKAWERVMEYGLLNGMNAIDENSHPRLLENAAVYDSGYDAIAIPEESFEPGVQRVKLNGRYPDAYRLAGSAEKFKSMLPYVSRIGEHDQVIAEDDSDWAFDRDLQDMKDAYATFPTVQNDEGLEKLWKELEDSVKKYGGRFKGVWPCSIIMATKKKS